jgi:tRNA pseudouridine38-40 synthase
MSRYFLEVAYKGTRYSGFQIQQNAPTIQSEIEKALDIILSTNNHVSSEDELDNGNTAIKLTGSSRTDSGVHAFQNYFHFDFNETLHPQLLYKLNAVLPLDIVIKSLRKVSDASHCRFDAISRSYSYYIYTYKDPFLIEQAYHYPYSINYNLLNEAASIIKDQTDFSFFSKSNSQVKNFNCLIYESYWQQRENQIIYNIKGNRFLRGMVRLLTGTMLQIGRGKISIEELHQYFSVNKTENARYAVPAKGLFLTAVEFPENYFSI